MYRVYTDVFTTSYPDRQYLNVWIEVHDTEYKNTPENISSIEVEAPDGSIFPLTVVDHWQPLDKGFWCGFTADDFPSRTIPAGQYIITVVPKKGYTISKTDFIDATFLPVPEVTFPVEGAVIGNNPTFRWNPVSGATHYRVQLWNESWNEPVYWYFGNNSKVYTELPGFMVPSYQLKPNTNYRLRIEARFDNNDTDKRSRSDWITFSTDNW